MYRLGLQRVAHAHVWQLCGQPTGGCETRSRALWRGRVLLVWATAMEAAKSPRPVARCGQAVAEVKRCALGTLPRVDRKHALAIGTGEQGAKLAQYGQGRVLQELAKCHEVEGQAH
ncbi:uncharacterized protein LOC62_04G006019 [Vanrija pseudolonga]|uniref:Uncharacterized protein n=1 Tax=Vanrija pseudolonga TaxID=143232 RepID=A0AAF0Y9G8_9TREE|nr:hypothetical protein LOC62_04G006019 [Vanrija pseudolonga]